MMCSTSPQCLLRDALYADYLHFVSDEVRAQQLPQWLRIVSGEALHVEIVPGDAVRETVVRYSDHVTRMLADIHGAAERLHIFSIPRFPSR
jgi:hypothetical protein